MNASFAGPPQADLLQANGEIHFTRPQGSAVAAAASGGFSPPTVTLNASLKNAPPDKIYHLILGGGGLTREQRDLYALLGQYSVTADLAVTTDFNSISLTSRAVTITEWNDPATMIRFGLSADTDHLSLSDFTGTWKGFTVEGSFDGRFAAGGEIAFTTGISFLGTPYSLTGRYSPKLGMQMRGSYGLAISATPLTGRVIAFHVQGDRFPLPVNGHLYAVSFQMHGLSAPGGVVGGLSLDRHSGVCPFSPRKRTRSP